MKNFILSIVLLAVIAPQAEACRFRFRRCLVAPPAAKAAEAPMPKVRLQDVYNETARRADTPKQKINASEVSRVLAKFFDVLGEYHPAQATQIVADGLRASQKRQAKK